MSLRDKIERGRKALEGGVRAVSSPDLFPTPPDVAERLAEYLELFPGCRVLEPSVGTGSLVRAVVDLEPSASVCGYEINRELAMSGSAYWADFLEIPASPEFDRVVMNPPFSKGADMRHVEHALGFLKPGGLIVAIVADGPRQESLFADWQDLERLPSGTFDGTGVRARVVGFYKSRKKAGPGECSRCDEFRAQGEDFHPNHYASSRCESGGRNHCTCDVCF